MNHDEVRDWLNRYIEAWASNEAEAIGALFSEDATYSYRPWESEDDTVKGRSAIVTSWQDQALDPSTWEAQYEPYVVEGNRAVAVGSTRYLSIDDKPERRYHNAYLLEFDGDGRCTSFHEFWVSRKR